MQRTITIGHLIFVVLALAQAHCGTAEPSASQADAIAETGGSAGPLTPGDGSATDGSATDGTSAGSGNARGTAEVATADGDGGPGPDSAATVDTSASDAGPGDAGGGVDAGDVSGSGTCVAAPELCDGKDNDCDGQTDEVDGAPLCKVDSKGPCASEVCKQGACVAAALAGPCDDGDPCTEGDACSFGNCKAGANAKNCDDANECTLDSCALAVGCKHQAQSITPCNDGNNCTTEACADGICKATPQLCDDKQACTDDSCNPQTGCVFAPIGGCIPCADKAECDDKNSCTTDACTAGKCANAPIANCSKATDYTIVKVSVAATKFDATTGMSAFTVEIGNQFDKALAANSTLTLWLSPIDGKGANAVQIGDFAGPILTNFTAPTTVKATVNVNHQVYAAKLPTGIAAMQFACFELTVASDGNPANNVTCTAIEPHVPDFSVEAIASGGAPLDGKAFEFGSAPLALKATVKNQDGFCVGPADFVQAFYAADMLGTAGVIALGWATSGPNNGTIAVGQSAEFGFQVKLDNPAMAAGAGFVCVRAVTKSVPTAWAPTPQDDVKCAAITLKKSPDLAIAGFQAPPASLPGNVPQSQGLTLGQKFQCSFDVVNAGVGPAAASKASCAMFVAGSTTATWTGSADVGGLAAGGTAAIAGDLTTLAPELLPGAKLGHQALKFCATADSAAAVAEVNESNNALCQDVYLFAQNYAVIDGAIGSGGSKVTHGAKLSLTKMTVKNLGNLSSSPNFSVQVLLSKDNALSADDIVLCGGPTTAPAIAPNGLAVITSGTYFGGQTCQVPADYATGPAYVLYVVDPNQAVLEFVESDNIFVQAVTVL